MLTLRVRNGIAYFDLTLPLIVVVVMSPQISIGSQFIRTMCIKQTNTIKHFSTRNAISITKWAEQLQWLLSTSYYESSGFVLKQSQAIADCLFMNFHSEHQVIQVRLGVRCIGEIKNALSIKWSGVRAKNNNSAINRCNRCCDKAQINWYGGSMLGLSPAIPPYKPQTSTKFKNNTQVTRKAFSLFKIEQNPVYSIVAEWIMARLH